VGPELCLPDEDDGVEVGQRGGELDH
jgi:hypothetical protein